MAEISAYQVYKAKKPSPAKKQQQKNAALSPKNAPKHSAKHNGKIKDNGAKQNGVAKSPQAVQKMAVASPKKVLKANGSAKRAANSNLNESQRKKKQMSSYSDESDDNASDDYSGGGYDDEGSEGDSSDCGDSEISDDDSNDCGGSDCADSCANCDGCGDEISMTGDSDEEDFDDGNSDDGNSDEGDSDEGDADDGDFDDGASDEEDFDDGNSDDGEEYEEMHDEDQFSEEYTINDGDDDDEIESPVVAPPKAGRRSQDANNNVEKPALTSFEKLAMSALKAVVKSCPLPGTSTVKSCPLPKKTEGAKSCPLPPKAKTEVKKETKQQTKKDAKEQTKKETKEQTKKDAKQQAKKETKEQAKEPKKSTKQEAKQPPATKTKETLLGRRQHEEGEATKAAETGNSQPKQRRIGHLDKPACEEVHLQDSVEEGKRALSWLMNPIEPQTFFQRYWEQNACQVVRRKANYFSHLMSFPMIEEMLLKNHLEFTTNIDITSYENGKRETHNPDGRAMPPTVWGYYSNGCSVRILNPSTYLVKLRALCTRLQEFFHCLVGANAYLTPPNSQGFAPHYDDIEAFVLQVEGRKRWRLYMPPSPSDILARVSSGNYSQKDLGPPTLDVVLEPGDILYFPRGTVHQAVTEEQQHSLHITLSVYQQQSYANLVEKLMPSVMERAIRQHLNLRRGLPLETWRHLGLAAGGEKSEERDKLLGGITKLVQTYLLPSAAQIDAAVDQLAKRFQHEALPPIVQDEEKARTVFGSVSETDKQGNCLPDYNLTGSTEVRLLRANILRLIAEGSAIRIYYYLDNALEYCKFDANYMEIQPEEAPAVEALIKAYPKYTSVKKLPLRSQDRRIEVATALWERGLLMTKKPFK
ncbi:bifunctional lysine-specific demethylase and histidyl-hydroxylase NO66 [Drosophila albomicans]|uniref:Bifunctional lysine-specific demethylase and histidyl-hydroxylase n=1 Tax=Drosophila albomicans TaxID=7291 RepID=A0A6P8XA38_DROAB|nr:bifunctional lysine-specific demethylase and histidyl-hydroxylase NO66 [Drosophila albomicans]